MNEDIRREGSVPVQSRVDIRTLAELSQYFAEGGIRVSTVSQLVSWSLEVLIETLRRNEKVGEQKPTIEAAYQYLDSERLMQRGMRSKKLLKARGWEVLRMEGEDPRVVAAGDYKSIHNNPNWTGEMSKLKIESDSVRCRWTDEQWNEMIRKGEDEETEGKRKRGREEVERHVELARKEGRIDENGMISSARVEGGASGIATQKDYNEMLEREEERKRIDKEDKEIGKVDELIVRKEEEILGKEVEKDG